MQDGRPCLSFLPSPSCCFLPSLRFSSKAETRFACHTYGPQSSTSSPSESATRPPTNMDSSRYDDNAGLGLGLGLPSVFGFNNGSLRAPTDKTVKMGSVPIDSASPEYLFPIPAQRSRSASSSSIRVRNLVSYWSPVSDEGEMESFDDEDELEHFHEDEGEDPRGDHQGQEQCCNIALPSGLHVHQCLHMLSPKGDTLARAAAANGLTAEEAISSALEWAWLVPMLGKPWKLPRQAHQAV